MKCRVLFVALAVACVGGHASAQTAEAYGDEAGTKTTSGLLDPSRFSMHHSVSFGMAASRGSSLQSQSLATTMLEYKFSAPLTLNLDFGFPIHSTFREDANLTRDNLQNLEYFRNMPLAASLTWQPSSSFMMRLSVLKNAPTNESVYPGFMMMQGPGLLGEQ